MLSAGEPQRTPGWFWLGVLACTLLAGALRLHRMEAGSFWNDELYTVTSAVQTKGTNLSKRLGYVPTRAGLALGGVDFDSLDLKRPETWKGAGVTYRAMRWPHVLIGTLTIPLLMLAGRRVIGTGPAAMFGLLLSVNAWHIYWSQTARFYIIQFLFFNLALLLWYAGTERRNALRYGLAMLCAFLAFWSQPLSLLVFGVMGIDWLAAIYRRRPVRLGWWQWAMGIAAVGACVGILGWDMTHRAEEWTHFFAPAERWLGPHEVVLAVGFFIWPATAVFGVCAGLWLMRERPRLGVLLVAGGALPPLVFAGMSPFTFVGSRYAFVCMGSVLAIVAIGLVELFRLLRSQGHVLLACAPVGAIVVGQAFATVIYFRSGDNYHLPMRDVAVYLADHRAADEPVYAHEPQVLAYELEQPGVDYAPFEVERIEAMAGPAWFVFSVSPGGELDRRGGAKGLVEVASFRSQTIHSRGEVRVYRKTAAD